MQSRNFLYGILVLALLGTQSALATPPEMMLPPTEQDGYRLSEPLWESERSLPSGDRVAFQNPEPFEGVVIAPRSALGRWWHDRFKPHMQYSHWGYPEYFEEMPLGSSLRAHTCTQIAMGLKERLVLYRYDFHENGTSLNHRGMQRLSDLAAAFPHWAQYRLVIEATPEHPQLAIARRDHVRHLLGASNIPAIVEVDVPRSPMRQGYEVILMNQNFLRQLESSAAPIEAGNRAGSSSAFR